MQRLSLILPFVWITACGEDTGSLTCPEGVVELDGVCTERIQCGAGTHLEGAICMVNDPRLRCGPGTVEMDGACVTAVACGPGTTQLDDLCVPIDEIQCGPGTILENGVCTPQIVCGPGTVQVADACLPEPLNPPIAYYDVRVGSSAIFADGFSRIPVLALGRQSNGLASTEEVFLSLSRAGAGSIQDTRLRLAALGATTNYTACSSAENPTCTGELRLRIALFSRPHVILAESPPFVVVEPPRVGSMAPCQAYANALFFEGTGYIFTGIQTITEGSFVATLGGFPPYYIRILVEPLTSSQGLWWNVDFGAPPGLNLSRQVYPRAERYPSHPPGTAGLSVSGQGRVCSESSGRFQIHRLEYSGSVLTRFEATFEQSCELDPLDTLRGCVRLTQ